MRDFQRSYISDVSSLISRGITPKYAKNKSDETISVINQRCIRDGKVNFSLVREHDLVARKIGLEKILKTGDTLVNSTGVGTLGRTAYFGQKEDAYTVDSHVTIVRPRVNIHPRWLSYALRNLEPEIEFLGEGSTGQTELSRFRLAELPLLVPPFTDQQVIAATLGALDDKIESNNKKHEKIESLVGHLFMKLIDEGQEANRMGTLGELGEIVAGSTPRRSNSEYWTTKGIAWITPKDLSVQGLKFISHGANDITDLGYASTSTRLIPSGSVLFSSRAPIGYTAVALNQLCTNQGFKSIVPNENIGTAFTYCTLKLLTPTIEKYAGGSTFKEISASAMRGIACVIPSLNLIKNFDSRAKELFDLQASLERQNAILASLRDALLPELMSGRIRVPEA